MDSIKVIDEIMNLFKNYGSYDYIGETDITQIQHMFQCAMLAEKDTNDINIIIAALLHDIGHFIEINNKDKQMGSFGVMNHELIGKEYLLSKGFENKVACLVGNHVKSKRYLVTKYPEYFNKLSEASKQTLIYQNGFMNNNEMIEFEKDPYFEESIKIRSYDDQAKIKDFKINSIDYYKNMLIEYFDNLDKYNN